MLYQILPNWGFGNMMQVYASALTLGEHLHMPTTFVTNIRNFQERNALFDDKFAIARRIPQNCIHEKMFFKPNSPCYTTDTNCYHFPEMVVRPKYLNTTGSLCIGMTIYSYIAETMDMKTYLHKMQQRLQRVRPVIPLTISPIVTQCIAVHYRHGDNCRDASKRKLPNSCPKLEKFIFYTMRLSSLNMTLIIASDSEQSAQKLHRMNRGSIVLKGTPIQIIDVLSRCRMVLGTVSSTFGYIAAYRGNIPFIPVI